MPKKSRRSKILQYQRKQERQHLSSAGGEAPVATPPVKVVTPRAAAPASRKTVAGLRYPYVAAELRRIGLLAGIMLAALIVLALVLS